MAGKGTLLVGYDVENEAQCADFLTRMTSVHEEFEAPCTVFALGCCLVSQPQAFEEAASNRLVDIAQHTWSHILLKTIVVQEDGKTELVKGASVDQIEDEIVRTNDALASICGVTCVGLTGPWCYYRGLMDRLDLLQILRTNGIRYLRTYGRNERDFQPVSIDLQPFWYDLQGFPDMLECMVHGWHDVYLRARVGWDNIDAFVDYMKVDLNYASENDLVFSWSSHDWSALREDPTLWVVRGVLRHARDLGMEIVSYKDYWSRRDKERLNQARAAA